MANAAVHLNLSRSPTTSGSRATSISMLPSPMSFSSASSSSPMNQSMAITTPTMASVGAPPTKATHTCPSCSRSFSRGEHLDRHLTTHLPSNSSKAFICQSCSKGFTRKDVLTRHIRAVHETKRSDVRKSRRRSCRRCAGFKIKCSGGGRGTGKDGAREGGRAEDPCEACKKRGAVCIYDFGTISEAGDAEPRSGGLDMSPDTTGEGRNGDGDDDDLLDFGSDGNGSMASESEMDRIVGSDGGDEGRKKRRKIIDGNYTTSFTDSSFDEMHRSPSSRVSTHLLSAARIASSDSGSPGRHSGRSSSPSAGLRNLISNDQAAELSSADQLLSLMTTNTYEQLRNARSPSSSRLNSGTQTPKNIPLSVDIPVFGAKPQGSSKFPLIPAVSQPPDLDLLRGRTDYFQSRKPTQPSGNPFSDNPMPYILTGPLSPFRDVLPSPSSLGKPSSEHNHQKNVKANIS